MTQYHEKEFKFVITIHLLTSFFKKNRERMKGRNKHVEGLLSIVYELSDKLIS